MAFWRFGFAQESGIDGLLKSWEPSSSSLSSSAGAPASGSGSSPSSASFSGGSTSQGPSASTSNPFVRSSPADPTAEADAATAPSLSAPAGSSQPSAGGTPAEPEEKPTLEQLLEEEDLLQECKTGHTKLVRRRPRPFQAFAVWQKEPTAAGHVYIMLTSGRMCSLVARVPLESVCSPPHARLHLWRGLSRPAYTSTAAAAGAGRQHGRAKRAER